MTKVQIHFHLLKPLDDDMMKRIADTHTVYGIHHVKIDPSLNGLTVDYDASRLGPPEVEAALGRAGIPVETAGRHDGPG